MYIILQDKSLVMNTIEALNWRYSVKKYKPIPVESENVNKILEATNLSASSTGLQPYRIITVSNKDLQDKLGEGSFNPQLKEASHLLVFAAFENVTEKRIDDYINLITEVRQVPAESVEEFKNTLYYYFLNRSSEENFAWAAKQAYIGLGTAMIAAAELQIDSTPMEGFDPEKFDELLNLKEKGLKSVVVLSLGYRDEANDIFSQFKKVRLPIGQFVISEI